MRANDNIENIVTEYAPRLLGYIRSQVGCREDAEDILQDVFYQLARASTEDGTEIERISSWLYRVARNSVLNFWRRKREVMLETEDIVCEDIARTLFCGPPDAPTRFSSGNLSGRNLTQPWQRSPPSNEKYSA